MLLLAILGQFFIVINYFTLHYLWLFMVIFNFWAIFNLE